MADDELMLKYYDKWKTFQVSDQMPLWVEMGIDFSGGYLEKLNDL